MSIRPVQNIDFEFLLELLRRTFQTSCKVGDEQE